MVRLGEAESQISWNDADIESGPVLVRQYAPANESTIQDIHKNNIVAGLICDATGTHSLTADDAKHVEVVSDGVSYNPHIIDFAPLEGTNHLIFGFYAGPKMGYGQLVEVSKRGGIRAVRMLWWI
jgi:hypothetical protein